MEMNKGKCERERKKRGVKYKETSNGDKSDAL